MARVAALVLALLSAAASWALMPAAEFDLLVGVGTVSLLAGLWVLAQRLPMRIRLAVAAVALTALPATAGLRMKLLAGSIKPFSSGCLCPRDLSDVTLPLASEGELPARGKTVIVNLDRHGVLTWKGKNLTLADWDEVLDAVPALRPIVVRADKDTPSRLLGWLVLAVKAHGRTEVRIAASKGANGFLTEAEAEALAADQAWRYQYWPEVELPLPIASSDDGLRLRIVGTACAPGTWWGPGDRRSEVRMPAGVRYDLGGRTTEDLRELGLWMRYRPPRSIDADPAIPVKYVVAVENELRKAGHPLAPLLLPDPPSEAIRNAPALPYPTAD